MATGDYMGNNSLPTWGPRSPVAMSHREDLAAQLDSLETHLAEQLRDAEATRAQIREIQAKLQTITAADAREASIPGPQSPIEKVALFRSLFRGRDPLPGIQPQWRRDGEDATQGLQNLEGLPDLDRRLPGLQVHDEPESHGSDACQFILAQTLGLANPPDEGPEFGGSEGWLVHKISRTGKYRLFTEPVYENFPDRAINLDPSICYSNYSRSVIFMDGWN